MKKIFIDDREQSRIKPALEYYKDKADEVEKTHLLNGDYVFMDNDIRVAFEYKTIEDYLQSITDNRVFNQMINLSNDFDYHFLIIVGSDKQRIELFKKQKRYTGRYMTMEQYYGSIASICNFSSVLQVNTEKQAFLLMWKIAEHCTNLKPVLKRFNKSKGTPALRLLANNVNSVGVKLGERICNDLDLVSVSDVLDLDKSDLVSVDGIGEVKAEDILLQLHREFDL